MIDIPPEFWKSLTEDEFRGICETSKLNRRQCRRLWAMLGDTSKPPRAMMVMLNKDDVLRVFPETEPGQLSRFMREIKGH